MKVIDADSHVMEVEGVWDHLPKEFENPVRFYRL